MLCHRPNRILSEYYGDDRASPSKGSVGMRVPQDATVQSPPLQKENSLLWGSAEGQTAAMEQATYLARARVLMMKQAVKAGALAIIPLATLDATAGCVAGPFIVETQTAQFESGGGPSGGFSGGQISGSETTDGAKFFGSVSISGSQWAMFSQGSAFTFSLNGSIRNPPGIPAGSTLALSWLYTATFTGGTVTADVTNTVVGQPSGEPITNSTGFDPILTGVEQSGSLESTPFQFDATGGVWGSSLNFQWTGFAAGDVLTITIPNNSVDSTINPVPEASSVVLALFGGGVLLLAIQRHLRRR